MSKLGSAKKSKIDLSWKDLRVEYKNPKTK
jgi:hypothetical protein